MCLAPSQHYSREGLLTQSGLAQRAEQVESSENRPQKKEKKRRKSYLHRLRWRFCYSLSFASCCHFSQHSPIFLTTNLYSSIFCTYSYKAGFFSFGPWTFITTEAKWINLVTRVLIFRGMLFHFYRHWNTAHQTYHCVSVFSHPLYNFSLATCFLAWRVWQRLGRERRRRERGKKARKTQSAMLLHIVRVDFPTQQGHWGGGLRFLYSWVSTFTVCHTTFLSTPPLLSWGSFKDIILYKNTQLLSDGNAPWLWLSGSSGNNRRDVSQALGRAKADSALWLVDRGVTWGDIHGEPWWG